MNARSLLLLLALTASVTGCELVGDLIELGFWMAIIAVVVVVAIATWIWNRLRGRRGP